MLSQKLLSIFLLLLLFLPGVLFTLTGGWEGFSLPDLSCVLCQPMVAHPAVIFHALNAFMSEQLCQRPVIQIHLCDLRAIVMPEHMGIKSEEFPVSVFELLLQDHCHDLSI